MNTWYPERAGCDVPEDSSDTERNRSSRGRKKVKMERTPQSVSPSPPLEPLSPIDLHAQTPSTGSMLAEESSPKSAQKLSANKKEATKPRDSKIDDSKLNKVPDAWQWVQCDKCKKWRILSRDVNKDELPDQWYCSMNVWDSK